MKTRFYRYFAPDTGVNVPSNNSESGQTLNTQNPPGQTPTPDGQTTNGQPPQQKTPIAELPQDVQDYIKRLRDEAEEANKKQKAEARAKQQAEEQRLKEQGEYKELAEKHEARVKELEPLQGRYEQLSQLVAGQIEAQIKDWPAEIKVFDPGADAPIEQRLGWLEKSKPLIEKLQQQARSQQPGNGPNPRPSQAPNDTRTTFEQRLRASGKYGA